jgi:hypothetical protein
MPHAKWLLHQNYWTFSMSVANLEVDDTNKFLLYLFMHKFCCCKIAKTSRLLLPGKKSRVKSYSLFDEKLNAEHLSSIFPHLQYLAFVVILLSCYLKLENVLTKLKKHFWFSYSMLNATQKNDNEIQNFRIFKKCAVSLIIPFNYAICVSNT